MPDQASPDSVGGAGYAGFAQAQTPLSDFASIAFIIDSMMGKMATATIVKVKAVTNAGGVQPVGYVDIQPMIKQMDAAGNTFGHGTIFHCPYLRLQGGTDAIILDPKVGDLGIAIFASADISSLAANSTAAQAPGYRGANPGSRRRFAWADALYIGGLLNGTPQQYLQFSGAGVKVESPVMFHVHAPNALVQVEAAVIEASTSVEIETPSFDVDADSLELNATGAANVGGATTTITGIGALNLVSASLQYNGTPFDPTRSNSGLPAPPPSGSPGSTPGDLTFTAPSDTTVIMKRRGSDGLVYGFQFDLALVP